MTRRLGSSQVLSHLVIQTWHNSPSHEPVGGAGVASRRTASLEEQDPFHADFQIITTGHG